MRYSRCLPAALAAALAVGAGYACLYPVTPVSPAEAVALAPSHAYHWADLAESFASENRLPEARVAFQQALALSHEVPQIWLRCANFHFSLNEPAAALPLAARVIRLVPDYDDILFSYFERFAIPPARILAALGPEPRPAQAYFQYLLGANDLLNAALVWTRLSTHNQATLPLASAYLDALLRHRQYSKASSVWSAWLGPARRGDYPQHNLLFNGSFDDAPSGAALDWLITPIPAVLASFDSDEPHHGSRALRLQFMGIENLSYGHVTQVVPVFPGQYRLSFWVRSDSLTTDEGPRLELTDIDNPTRFALSSDPITGSHPWTRLRLSFSVPASTHALALRVTRRPSVRFDSKIAGTFWLDQVVLQPTGTSSISPFGVIHKNELTPSFSLLYRLSDRRIW